jgi:dTDP-4-dehydrorhamnose 3,5-epimerase
MKFTPLAIPDVVIIAPDVYSDDRGFFFESYQRARFSEHGITNEFVQDNHSRSARGVVRGLHFQLEPFAQGKLVRVIQGAIYDVAVDIRQESATFGKWVGERLDTQNRHMLYIPPGFAHGFCALEDNTEILYKASRIYSPARERGLAWDDPDIGIKWPVIEGGPSLSEKDRAYPRLRVWAASGGD